MTKVTNYYINLLGHLSALCLVLKSSQRKLNYLVVPTRRETASGFAGFALKQEQSGLMEILPDQTARVTQTGPSAPGAKTRQTRDHGEVSTPFVDETQVFPYKRTNIYLTATRGL